VVSFYTLCYEIFIVTIALLQHFSNSNQHCGQVLSTAPQFVMGFCLSVIEYTVCRFLSTFQDQLTVCNKHYYFSFDNPVCFSLRIVYCTLQIFTICILGGAHCLIVTARGLLQSGTCLFQLATCKLRSTVCKLIQTVP